MFHPELQDVQRRLRKLQRMAATRKKAARAGQGSGRLRCEPCSPSCLAVLACSGGAVDVAAEFVQGRGWLKRKRSLFPVRDARTIEADIEDAYDLLPLAQIAALHDDPVQAGLVTEAQMLALIRWLVERSLCNWVGQQNRTHGVAPSRAQLVDHALSAIPSFAPHVWEQKFRLLIASMTRRRQKKWLAKFRSRWGLRLGRLQRRSHLSLEEKRAKEGLGFGEFGGFGASLFLVVFGKAGNGSGWGKKQVLHLGSLQPHFWACLALPFLGASALSGESVLPMGQRSLCGRSGQPSTFADQYG